MMENVSIKYVITLVQWTSAGTTAQLLHGNHQTIAQMCDAAGSKAPTGFADLITVGYDIMIIQTDVMEMLHNSNSTILMV